MASLKKNLISYRSASVLLFAILLVFIWREYRSYGIAWDEPLRLSYGRYLLSQYARKPADPEDIKAVESTNLYLYGGAFDIFATSMSNLLAGRTTLDEVERWHLVNGLVGFLGVLGCWWAGKLLAGEAAAFWSALLLLAIPGYSGQIFINPKDIPLAVGTIWSLAFLLVILKRPARFRFAALAGFALSSGLAMGVRAGGIILLVYLLLALILYFWSSCRVSQPNSSAGRLFFTQVIIPFSLTSLAALGLMWAFWPWAAADPLRRTFQALAAQSRFDWANTTLFGGRFLSPEDLPWSYIFEYLLITLPELVLVLLGVGVLLGIRALAGRKLTNLAIWPEFQGYALLIIAIITPVLAALLGRAVLYDGIRHLTFILPPLACLAGASLAGMLSQLRAWRLPAYWTALGLTGLFLIYHILLLARLHPYEYVYYNRLVGGLPGAVRRYETEYWGTAFSESARWLVSELQNSQSLDGDRFRVYLACGNDFSANFYFPKGIKITHDPQEADFYLGGVRWFCQENLPGEPLFTVSRMGIPLAVVKEP